MNRPSWLRLSWLFNRRVGVVLLWTLLVFCAAFIVNLIGIQLLGSVARWQQWLQAHAQYFLLWRLCLYAVIAWGWRWLRERLRQDEPAPDSRARWGRVEVAAVAVLLMFESSQLLQRG